MTATWVRPTVGRSRIVTLQLEKDSLRRSIPKVLLYDVEAATRWSRVLGRLEEIGGAR